MGTDVGARWLWGDEVFTKKLIVEEVVRPKRGIYSGS